MSKEIMDISVQRMNNGAHYLYARSILVRAQADETVMNKVADLVEELAKAVADEDAMLKLSRKNLLSDDIAKADDERDKFYLNYKHSVETYYAASTGEIAEAAKILRQHIKDYKIETRMQLDTETGLLKNFTDDLDGKYKEQVAKLSLTPIVTMLKEANERVMTLTLQRTNERMGHPTGALRKARANTDTAYRALVKMVNALAVVNGDEDYESFIDYVNTEVSHYKREVIKQKATVKDTSSDSNNNAGTDDDNASDSGNDAGNGGDSSSDNGNDADSGSTTPSDDGGSSTGGSSSDDNNTSSGSSGSTEGGKPGSLL